MPGFRINALEMQFLTDLFDKLLVNIHRDIEFHIPVVILHSADGDLLVIAQQGSDQRLKIVPQRVPVQM